MCERFVCDLTLKRAKCITFEGTCSLLFTSYHFPCDICGEINVHEPVHRHSHSPIYQHTPVSRPDSLGCIHSVRLQSNISTIKKYQTF